MHQSPQLPTKPATGRDFPTGNDAACAAVQRQPGMVNGVGEGGHRSTAVRRVRFVGRFIYWTCRHGSPNNAAWVCNYEGLYW